MKASASAPVDPVRAVRTADVLRLAGSGVIPARAVGRALQLAGCAPTAAGWVRAVDRLLLGVGAALVLAGIVCVVAYNWAGLTRWARFGLVQAVLLLVFGLALRLGPGSRHGKLLLTAAIVLVGPLLALFGQTYQTGADVADLFRSWAFLTLPWVLASCFAPAWLVWLVVVQTWLTLHVHAFDLWWRIWFGFAPTWMLACILDALILALWEAAAERFAWLRAEDMPRAVGRSGPWLIAAVLLGLLTGLVCALILAAKAPGLAAAPVAWALVMAAGYYAYRVRRVDLVMLAFGWMSLTAVALVVLLRLVDESGLHGFALLLGAALLVASSAFGRQWLRNVAQGAPASAAGAPDG